MSKSAIMIVVLGVLVMLLFGYVVDLHRTTDEHEEYRDDYMGHQVSDIVRTSLAYAEYFNRSVSGEVVDTEGTNISIRDENGEVHHINTYWIVRKGE